MSTPYISPVLTLGTYLFNQLNLDKTMHLHLSSFMPFPDIFIYLYIFMFFNYYIPTI